MVVSSFRTWISWLLIVLLMNFCAAIFRPNSVITMLDAKWEQTPLVLEIAEFLADQDNKLFWSYIDNMSAFDPPLSEISTEKAKYEASLAEAAKVLSAAQINLLKIYLSLHIYSPRIEAYSQIASERNLPCSPIVDLGDISVCSVSDLSSIIENEKTNKRSETFRMDHHYPGSANRSLVAILYGEIGTPDFVPFHRVLKQYATDGKIDYILRHHVKERLNQKVRLSGYGVELQMKSTEYKAQDDTGVEAQNATSDIEGDNLVVEGFDFKRLKELYPEKAEDLEKFRLRLLESVEDLAPLQMWQFQELGAQAAQFIMNASVESVLQVFTNIAQNFPMQTRSLVNIEVNSELKKEMEKNQEQFLMSLSMQSTETGLFINGLYFDIEMTDIITILENIRNELIVMEGIYNIGIKEKEIISSLITLDLSDSSGQDFAIDIRDSAIQWIIDVEKDSKFDGWPTYISDLLKPTFPGMLRRIRRNFFNLVIICDPAHRSCWPLLKMAESFIIYGAPVRIGVLFVTPPLPVSGLESASVALLNAFNYITETKDPKDALSFITDVYATIKKQNRDVNVDDVKSRLKQKYYSIDTNEILGSDSDYNTGRQLASDFISRSGITSFPQVLLNGVPIDEKLLTKEDFEDAVFTQIMTQTSVYQRAVYKGKMSESDDVIDFIMSQPNVMPRLNNRILKKEMSTYLDLSRTEIGKGFLSKIKYLESNEPSFLTYWIVGDFDSENSRKLLHNALEYMDNTRNSRLAVLVNPADDVEESQDGFNRLLLAGILQEVNIRQLLKNASKAVNEEKFISELNTQQSVLQQADDIIKQHKKFVSEVLRFQPGEVGVVVNGRILGPFDQHEEFSVADFILLEKHVSHLYIDRISKLTRSSVETYDPELRSDIFMILVSLLMAKPSSKVSRVQFPSLSDKYSVVKLPARTDNQPAFDICVIVDPVSRGAQKVGPILSALYEILNAEIKIYLNAVEKHSDMPLKSYYRFVLEPELRFTENGDLADGPIANFTGVSPNSLLTQNMHVPENWIVESVMTPYDLDNIRLKDVGGTVFSQFELEYLLLEGHCFDNVFHSPPRGLQMTLGTETNPVMVDTIVMANLGYFQLKANSGAWILRLRQGRSADLYDIVSHEGTDTPPDSSDIKVLVNSFQSQILKLKVSKKPDKIHEQLLEDEDESAGGIWSSIANTFNSKQDTTEDEPVNVYSVASGHLYERFLKIMMLSVIKHTKSPVKFWFLKNYLSPTFKDFLPKMAEKYNFQYELVQYKWPRWLHQQTEKQRIIWGYKILFLDVLFPLDVKKIIFVDADQVVRADLKELVLYDLQGAPYGYTPFCDSRKEMDGFRFWKRGYWEAHLQGTKYHISALYVVDLKRFRKIAAGDRLRGQYQALSQDPNSLSNLDQDLPNNMVHQVAIKSLPQEWLWCETWCDDESKKYAKTIDLCNNPLTKESKLTAAIRIIEEWKDYDEEIRRLQLGLDELPKEEEILEKPLRASEKHEEL